jgi:adenine phosphoribosyltransferase
VDTELKTRLREAFRWINRGRKHDQLVSDYSGWWRDSRLLQSLGPALAEPFEDSAVTVVIGPESRGFLLGPLTAAVLGAGFVEAFKNTNGGELGEQLISRNTPPDYRDRNLTLSVRARLLSPSDRVLVVDDWAETGGQLTAIARIIADAGAEHVGTALGVDAMPSGTRRTLRATSLLRIEDLR